MRGAAGWLVAVLIGVAAVVGLIALLQSRDDSAVDEPAAAAEAPGGERTVKLPAELERRLKLGNVVLLHRAAQPPAEYADQDPALVRAGQAVITRREPALDAEVVAVAATRELKADSADDVSEFVDYWLGGR